LECRLLGASDGTKWIDSLPAKSPAKKRDEPLEISPKIHNDERRLRNSRRHILWRSKRRKKYQPRRYSGFDKWASDAFVLECSKWNEE